MRELRRRDLGRGCSPTFTYITAATDDDRERATSGRGSKGQTEPGSAICVRHAQRRTAREGSASFRDSEFVDRASDAKQSPSSGRDMAVSGSTCVRAFGRIEANHRRAGPNPHARAITRGRRQPSRKLTARPPDTDADWSFGSAPSGAISTRLSASVASNAMLSLLFVLGLLVGIVGAAIVTAGVLIAVVTAAGWLKALVVFLRARSNQPQPANRATALTTRPG